MQKCVKIYKDGGAKIFQKSLVNQPNQGHQAWQSNSLIKKYKFLGPWDLFSSNECPKGPPGTPGHPPGPFILKNKKSIEEILSDLRVQPIGRVRLGEVQCGV